METILCSMGLPLIDESMGNMLDAMKHFPNEASLGNCVSLARALGLLLALGVGSYECWMMMLGRRGMDVMKLLRIVILSMCISFSSWICSALQQPGYYLENVTRSMAETANKQVDTWQLEVANAQKKYIDSLREKIVEERKQQDAATAAEDQSWWDELKDTVANVMNNIEAAYKQWVVTVETVVTEFLGLLIKFCAEVYFQMHFYGLLLGQRIFIAIMTVFAPIEFALSLAPPFRSAWSQWMSKYLSLTLWGFVIYMSVFYIDHILIYCLRHDAQAYDLLSGSAGTGTLEEIGMLGMQGFGTTIMYVIVLCIGGFILRLAPEVASWLIPAGTSSGYGGHVGGAAAMAGTAAVNQAWRGGKAIVNKIIH